MAQFNDTFRIRGTVLDESDTYIDATVTGYALDGTVELTEAVSSDPRTWTLRAEQLQTAQKTNRLTPLSDLSDPDDTVWSEIKAFEKTFASNSDFDDSAESSQSASHETHAFEDLDVDLSQVVDRLFRSQTEKQKRNNRNKGSNNGNGQ